MKIVIVGGHHVSALTVARLLEDRDHQVFWLGTRYPRWPERTEGVEYRQVKAARMPFFDIRSGKFYKNFKNWWRIPSGFFQALTCLKRINPNLILSFGGYLAVPVVLAGWFLGIDTFTHEQTKAAGLANRFLNLFVKKIFLTWSSSAKFFPKDKTVLVGLPLRKEILFPKKEKIFPQDLPIILVVGGKQGSHIINCIVEKLLPKILSQYNLVHQCGDILAKADYNRLKKRRNLLPSNLKKRYMLQEFFSDKEMAQNLSQADFVIGRAGAHTIYELALVGKPAIFIPLPFAYASEQEKNANFFAKKGAAIIIEQKNLTCESLLQAIQKIQKNLKIYQKNAQKLSQLVRIDAGQKILAYVEKLSNEKKKV